jgi:hypothetical protein
VRTSHLHFIGRNSPFRGIKIELPPFGTAQLAGSNEDKRSKLECRTYYPVTAVPINGPQQSPSVR